MALSLSEMQYQTTEYLPSREVMSSLGGGFNGRYNETHGPSCNQYHGGILNGVNVQDVVSDLNVDSVQVSLVNVLVEDVNDAIDIGSANYEA
jgi:hypothetical protein